MYIAEKKFTDRQRFAFKERVRQQVIVKKETLQDKKYKHTQRTRVGAEMFQEFQKLEREAIAYKEK